MVSMTEKYVSNNFRDAAEKMANVIGLYKGDWVYVSNWHPGSGVAHVTPIYADAAHHKTAVDFSTVKAEEFSFGPYPLGFCEANDELYYVSRDPVRKNKFGLREDNMSWTLIASKDDIEHKLRPSPFSAAWRQNTLYNMLRGEYDGFKVAASKFKSIKVLFAPINRDFALVRVGLQLCGLFYKTEQVGEVDLKTGQVHLYPSFDHLQERVNRNVLET